MAIPDMVYKDLGERFADIKMRISKSLERSSRPANDVTLIAISKTHPSEAIKQLLSLGAIDIGENRVQEAEGKIETIGRGRARWHLVGHLQTNKARRAVKLFDVLHSLDSVDLAHRLDRLCKEEGTNPLQVLIQVDLGMEETKSGIPESSLMELAHTVRQCERLRLLGLMTLPPYFDEPQAARPFFRRLAALRNELKKEGLFGGERGELSMGMTHDFEVAIEEGATMVRIGTAIFGERA